jgi:hypothetical protein
MRKPLEKKQSKLKNIFIAFIAVTSETIIITYPALCAIMGLGFKSAWSDIGFIISIVVGFVFGFDTKLVPGLGVGLTVGLGVGLIFGLGAGFIAGLVGGLIVGLGIGLIGRRIVELVDRRNVELFGRRNVGLVGGLVVGLGIGLVGAVVFGFTYGLVDTPIIGFYTGLGIFIGWSTGVIVGLLLWYAFKRLPEGFLSMVKGFFGSKQELKKYSFLRSLSSFFVGYVAVVLIFSLWFYACYLEGIYFTEVKSNSPFFIVDNINYPQWWDFIYYSFVTITTLGYGDITPLKVFPQILVTFESTIGVMLPAIFIGIILYVAGKEAEIPKPRDSDEPDY